MPAAHLPFRLQSSALVQPATRRALVALVVASASLSLAFQLELEGRLPLPVRSSRHSAARLSRCAVGERARAMAG